MQAVQFAKFGGPEVLEVVTKDIPKPGASDMLVKIAAAGVNPVDWKLREGAIPFTKLPMTLGGDAAGVVEQAPPGSGFTVGDRVFALAGSPKWGCYAEYVASPASQWAKMPNTVSFVDAASMPLTTLTAWDALDAANVKPGDHVLIHAGSGGVGSAAIQLAKTRGLKVSTTCSARNVDFVRELGADAVIDYTVQRFEEACERPVHGVIDTIGGDYEPRSLGLLDRSGSLVSLMANPQPLKIVKNMVWSWLRLGPRYKVMFVKSNGKKLAEVAKLMDEGKVKAHVQATFPLREVAQAHELSKTGRVRGKVVLVVDEELAKK